MSQQSSHTPAWGTPTTGVTGPNPAAETQVLPPISQVPPRGATRAEVELRVTAVHYAEKILGDQPIANADTKLVTILRVAKGVERYLLTGDTSAI